ncbi:hypothetical protein EB001_01330 [bacterium]|jgi:hypothetical protein|nr:hypothetical protein [bacterium]
MSESESASMNDDVWEFIADNPKIMGVPLTDNKGLDILSALRDVYMVTKQDPEVGMGLLTVLANVLVAAAQGEGSELLEEVTVFEAMMDFDTQVKEILDEGH